MGILVVVNNPVNWPMVIPGVEIVSAKAYLTDPAWSEVRNLKIFNLCRSYRYQSLGYYVSLLAAARGHNPLPSVMTIQDMKSQSIVRVVSDDLNALIQKSFAGIQSPKYTLSIYFGRNLAKKYDRLSQLLFNVFPAPLLRAGFVKTDNWQLQSINPIAASEIPDEHRPFVMEAARAYLAGRRVSHPKRTVYRYDLAILCNPEEKQPPSDEKAVQRFIKAAEGVGLRAEVLSREEAGRLLEFDALFIRETTRVNHHTYRLARRAATEGMVVIDDPLSILRCTNKVYLAELLEHHRVPTPKTLIVHRENIGQVAAAVGFPCVLKEPDSSFSQGVIKVDEPPELNRAVEGFLDRSDLILAQEFMPTDFDWRVGILDGKPLFVCKYFMARRHWQIIKRDDAGRIQEGRFATLPVEIAPRKVVRTALRAANLVGRGLYGVDLKEIDGKVYVIEINDNPSIDAGVEDAILKDTLYARVMDIFLKRIELVKERGAF